VFQELSESIKKAEEMTTDFTDYASLLRCAAGFLFLPALTGGGGAGRLERNRL
jgi:hypothetical protein